MATAALAAPQTSAAAMPLGQVALPPTGYVEFCQRRPADCGEDPQRVLEQARLAEQERRSLLSFGLSSAPAAVDAGAPATARTAWKASEPLLPAPHFLVAVVEAAAAPTAVAFIDPAAPREAPVRAAPPALTPKLWATLNRVNGRVNRAIVQRTDNQIYLRDDFWTTPLQDGLAVGDCEDFVLEKRRALLEAGVPAEALNIAVVVTAWGETHAVLLVNTSKGEFVLDNLSPWVVGWAEAPYRWRQRQVDGEAFTWIMAGAEAQGRTQLRIASR